MTKKRLADQIEQEKVAIEEPSTGLNTKVQKTRSRQKSYVMDLRIQSPASLGYLGVDGIDTAPALVRLAKVKGLDVIAVTDFYSGDFIDRLSEAAKETALCVIPGTMIRCQIEKCDDVTIACLFNEGFDKKGIETFLSELGIPQAAKGNEAYTVTKPFEQILAALEKHNGVALPTRMDKTPYKREGIKTLVNKYGFRAFDLAYPDSKQFFKQNWPRMKFQLFSFSNANALAQVGTRIAKVKMKDAGFEGLQQVVARVGV